MQATPEFVGEVARSSKKKGARDEPCKGSQCIIESVFTIVEKTFGHRVDTSSRSNACHEGDVWCVEDSAHNLCEYLDDEDNMAESEEEVEDDDEDTDYVPEEEAMRMKAAERKPTENPAKKAFDDEMALVNRQQHCFCGNSDGKGQPGIFCSEQGVATRTTTISGTRPPRSSSITSTSSVGSDVPTSGLLAPTIIVTVSPPTFPSITDVYVGPSTTYSTTVLQYPPSKVHHPKSESQVTTISLNQDLGWVQESVLSILSELPTSTSVSQWSPTTSSASQLHWSFKNMVTNSTMSLLNQTSSIG